MLVVLISVIAFDRLNFPQQLNVNVYHVTSKQIVESSIMGVIIIAITWVILRLIDFIVLVLQQRQLSAPTGDQLVLFFRDFLKVIVIILAGIIVLKFCFDAHIGNLITGLSIVGAALALAAKESLENLIASFIIFSDKPFTAGDLVKVNNFQGHVERIGLRSTRIRTAEKTLVIVPNKQMVDSIVDNWSMRNRLRNEIRTELSPQTSSQKIQLATDEIKKIVTGKQEVVLSSSVFLTEITKNAALIITEYFTAYSLSADELSQLKQDITIDIKKMLEQNEIRPAQTPEKNM